MTLHWKLNPAKYLDEMGEWTTTYRGCSIRILLTERRHYTVFVYRRHVLCTAYFQGADAFHRAKLAAPKLANVMIQHSATHHESKSKVKP